MASFNDEGKSRSQLASEARLEAEAIRSSKTLMKLQQDVIAAKMKAELAGIKGVEKESINSSQRAAQAEKVERIKSSADSSKAEEKARAQYLKRIMDQKRQDSYAEKQIDAQLSKQQRELDKTANAESRKVSLKKKQEERETNKKAYVEQKRQDAILEGQRNSALLAKRDLIRDFSQNFIPASAQRAITSLSNTSTILKGMASGNVGLGLGMFGIAGTAFEGFKAIMDAKNNMVDLRIQAAGYAKEMGLSEDESVQLVKSLKNADAYLGPEANGLSKSILDTVKNTHTGQGAVHMMQMFQTMAMPQNFGSMGNVEKLFSIYKSKYGKYQENQRMGYRSVTSSRELSNEFDTADAGIRRVTVGESGKSKYADVISQLQKSATTKEDFDASTSVIEIAMAKFKQEQGISPTPNGSMTMDPKRWDLLMKDIAEVSHEVDMPTAKNLKSPMETVQEQIAGSLFKIAGPLGQLANIAVRWLGKSGALDVSGNLQGIIGSISGGPLSTTLKQDERFNTQTESIEKKSWTNYFESGTSPFWDISNLIHGENAIQPPAPTTGVIEAQNGKKEGTTVTVGKVDVKVEAKGADPNAVGAAAASGLSNQIMDSLSNSFRSMGG
jgi:hypothetical protein